VAATREAKGRLPLLLIVLGEQPPIKISGHGRKTINDAIKYNLKNVLNKTEGSIYDIDTLEGMIDSSVAWITWEEIKQLIISQLISFENSSRSIYGCVSRLVYSITESIERHSK